MAEKETKDMKIVVKAIVLSDRQTSKGGKMFNVTFEVGGFANRAVTFSETIAAELEKNIGQEVPVQMEIGEYNGMPSYTIKSANGVSTSGFKGGKGYQRDTVSIERQKSSDIAERLLQHATLKEKATPKDVLKAFNEVADGVYQWISARPVEAKATGGATPQQTPSSTSDINLDDIPFD